VSAALKSINNQTAGADYNNDALTIFDERAEFVACRLSVNNAAVWYSVAAGPGAQWQSDQFQVPASGELTLGPGQGIRFKYVDPAANPQAQVSATMLTAAESGGGGMTPTTTIVQPSGVVVVGGGTSLDVIQLASFPPASPKDGDSHWLQLPSSYDPVGGKPIRWLVTYDAANALWHVTGAPLYAEVQTNEVAVNAGAYTDLATVGPAVSIPRGCDAQIEVGFTGNMTGSGGANTGNMAYSGCGIVAADADSAFLGNAPQASVTHTREKLALTAGTLTAKYKGTLGAQPSQFFWRFLRVLVERLT